MKTNSNNITKFQITDIQEITIHKLYLLWRACNRLIKGQVYNHHRQITLLIYRKGITHNIKATIATMTDIIIATIDTAHQPPTQIFI